MAQGLAMLTAYRPPEPRRALFRAVLAQALKDDDADVWLMTRDAELVCLLADIERSAVILSRKRCDDLPRLRVKRRKRA